MAVDRGYTAIGQPQVQPILADPRSPFGCNGRFVQTPAPNSVPENPRMVVKHGQPSDIVVAGF